MDIKAVTGAVANVLEARAREVAGATFAEEQTRQFPLGVGQAHPGEFDYKLKQGITITQGFYWIELKGVDSDTVVSAFLRNRSDEYKYSRFNKLGDNKALYVGRSSDLPSRLKQHVVSGPKGTYALHMSTWAHPLDGSIILHALSYPDVSDAALQDIEDGLWDYFKPVFGRRGTR